MTWTKLGDEFGDAAADLSDAAHRTHIDALNWSNRQLLNLVVPKRDLRRFAFSPAVNLAEPDSCPVVQELVSAAWWEDRGDSWYVGLQFDDWQLTREQVTAARARETKKKKRQRDRAKQDREAPVAPSSSSTPVPSRVPLGSPRGVSPGGVPGGTNAGWRCRIHGHEHAARRADGRCSACVHENLGPESVSA